MQSRKFRWWPTLRCFARVTEVAVRTLLATGLEDAFVLPYGGDHGARLADGERERLLAIDIQAGAGGAGCSAGTAGFASMFSLMTQPVPPAQRGKSVALYLKNPRLQLRAGFQGLESSRPVFPRIGKSRGNFSRPWKSPRGFFRASEIQQGRREDGKKTCSKSW
jgi:hypothetical protein